MVPDGSVCDVAQPRFVDEATRRLPCHKPARCCESRDCGRHRGAISVASGKLAADGQDLHGSDALLCFDVALDDFERRSVDRRHEVAVRPKRRQARAKLGELLSSKPRRTALHHFDEPMHPELGIGFGEDMHMIRMTSIGRSSAERMAATSATMSFNRASTPSTNTG